MPIIGSLAGASAKGLGGLGASVVPAVPTTLTTNYLVVAGGGGGGGCVADGYGGGGGGAGGLRSTVTATGGGGSLEAALTLSLSQIYAITVGAGGAQNTSGNDSVFSTITSVAGGRGTKETAQLAAAGGSGGGANANGSVANGTANQGFAGGVGDTTGNAGRWRWRCRFCWRKYINWYWW
jgi:hypothetical protein